MEGTTMILRYFYQEQLAQASYLLGCSGTQEALIIDPQRTIEPYLAAAARAGLRITAVMETHIHADFVSGARELAERTKAQLYLSGAGPQAWAYTYASQAGAVLLHDSDHVSLGKIAIDVLHVPGHTPEHLAFLVTDTATTDQPMGIFTGDFLFVGDVGRPDLLEKAVGVAGAAEQSARMLFRSLQRVRHLPDYLQVWPGHGAGSACGRALGAVPQSTIGYEKLSNWAFASAEEDAFVAAVLEGQSPPPPYFAAMKRVNRQGPVLLRQLASPEHLTFEQLAPLVEAGVRVVDTRPSSVYAAGHLPGTLNIPLGDVFLTWIGWLLASDQPFALLIEQEQLAQTVQQLQRTGFDTLAGFWTPDVLATWKARRGPLETLQQMNVTDLLHAMEEQRNITLLDVRNTNEYVDGSIAGSRNIPLGALASALADIPTDRPVVVQCQGGTRSAIGASLLAALGRTNVFNLLGGFEAWQLAHYPTKH